MSNSILVILVAISGTLIAILAYFKMRNESPERRFKQDYDMDTLLNRVKYKLADLVKESDDIYALDDDEYEARYIRQNRIIMALRNCVYCIDKAKYIVQELIREELADALPEEDDVLNVLNFRDRYISNQVKFEIIMYFMKKDCGKNALPDFIKENELDNVRYEIEDGKVPSYMITDEDIERIYRKLNYSLTYDNMLDILTVLVYQKYKGLGIVDTIREMNINGINCGVSGSVLSKITSGARLKGVAEIDATKSVWVQNNGRYIHFRFLEFEDTDEIRRITNLVIRYNSPGSLTEKRGFIVNTMYDKTRVLAMRPPMGVYWAFFLRKFTLANNELKNLLNPMFETKANNGETTLIPLHKNVDLPIQWGEWLMECQVTTAVTGRQSSGKTTTMKALVKFIDPRLNIRVLEMAPEMYLRELYPERNIYEAQETDWISTTKIQDAFKKSDGGVTIVGEVATAEMAARLIESAGVASQFGLFSSHHKTTASLVQNLRNNLVSVIPGTTAYVAEQQVINAIMADYHQDFDETGERFIDRLTEIVPLMEGSPYPIINPDEPLLSYTKIFREYAMRKTDRQTYTTRNLMYFDRTTRTYMPGKLPTAHMLTKMTEACSKEKVDEFREFIIRTYLKDKIAS